MKIGIIAWGSEGDIRPFIALATGLSKRGHQVDMVASSIDYRDFSVMLEGSGVRFSETTPIPVNREILEKMSRMAIQDRNPMNHFKFLLENLFDPLEDELMEESKRLCLDCDVVVKHLLVHPLAVVAESTGTPLVDVTPTAAAVPSPDIQLIGVPWTGRFLNSLMWKAASKVMSRMLRERVNSLRIRVGLAPLRDVHCWLLDMSELTLIGCSRALLPEKVEWKGNVHVCGSLELESGSKELSQELSEFLAAGPPPVYVSFGSMLYFEPEVDYLMETAAGAVLDAGQRCILQCVRDDLSWSPDNQDILLVGKTSHKDVFPHCRAVVHHGGAGTTHTVVASGLPSVVVMYGVDQLFWGPRLLELGVAPKPLLRRKLIRSNLSAAITEACESPAMRIRTKELASEMESEEGVRTAVELIEKEFSRG
ncbi:MAG: glycosyltransferase family 1 protein [Candidatus Aegiribacteria sp.]|nr:glycosyltransferase family 1 protein [Candidatus Aegiribacteria sp.]